MFTAGFIAGAAVESASVYPNVPCLNDFASVASDFYMIWYIENNRE